MEHPISDAPIPRLSRFFSKPVVGVVGTVASILGLIFALYFYLQTREYPSLTVFVHPVRASVVRAGQSSRLIVSFGGRPIATDITAVQVALWNAGKRPIREQDILEPLTIRTAGVHPILEATLRKQTRDVVRLELEKSHLSEGALSVRWRVLEQGDGGVIQLIYEGNPDVEISYSAVLVGQKAVAAHKYLGAIRSPEEQYKSDRLGWGSWALSIFMLASGTLILVRRFRKERPHDPSRPPKFIFHRFVIPMVGILYLFVGLSLLVGLLFQPASPPFDF